MMRQQKATLREVGIYCPIAFIFHSEWFLSVLSTKAPSFPPKTVVSQALVQTVSVDCDYVMRHPRIQVAIMAAIMS